MYYCSAKKCIVQFQRMHALRAFRGTDLFRYKGILAVKGFDQKMVFQGVHMMFSQALLDDQFWKPGEKRSCTFVRGERRHAVGRSRDREVGCSSADKTRGRLQLLQVRRYSSTEYSSNYTKKRPAPF